MIPELIYREEEEDNYFLLAVLGLFSGLIGFWIAKIVFPSQTSVLAVAFGSIPLVYPLTRSFLEDEKNGRPHSDEIFQYGALFVGEVLAFFALIYFISPENLGVQIAQFSSQLEIMGITSISGSPLADITGKAIGGPTFVSIFFHNLTVFSIIFFVSSLVTSSGAFILTWNASVLGVFLGILTKKLEGAEILIGKNSIATPIAYIPHATFEMLGFIIAGITGSLVSAALYREHFDVKTWKDYSKFLLLGVSMILLAAILETA